MNFESVALGFCSILIIGLFHPIVIKCEYYFSKRVWPIFFVGGIIFLAAAFYTSGAVADVSALFGAASLWSVRELNEQERRVQRGWFAKNPKRNYDAENARRGARNP